MWKGMVVMNIKKELENIKQIYDFELTSEQEQALDITIKSLEKDQKALILNDLKLKEQILIETIERDRIRLEMLRDTIRGIESLGERKE